MERHGAASSGDPVDAAVEYMRGRWRAYRAGHVLQSQLSYGANFYSPSSNRSRGFELERKVSPRLAQLGLRDYAISIVREEIAVELQAALALNPIEGAKQLAQAASGGFGLLRSDPAFEREHARMIDAVATGFEERVHDRMRPILTRARAGISKGTLQPVANQVASEALAPVQGPARELTLAVRSAFFRAVKDVVASSGDSTIAVCFVRAMSDVMVAQSDDTELRDDIATASIELRSALRSKHAQSADDMADLDEAIEATQNTRTRLLENDVGRNLVEVQYIKLYIALRQALEVVAEDWIKQTRDLQSEVDSATRTKLWISRGINLAWSFCPGPGAAVPVVLFGTISDIFSDALIATTQSQIASKEGELRARVAELLRTRLATIESIAQKQFDRISQRDLPALRERTFLSISAITAGYVESFRRALHNS